MERVASSHLSLKWLLLSAAAALWCVGWPAGLLELTWGYPGILHMKGHRGAFEVIELLTGVPGWVALLVAFLLVLILGWLVAASRRWLDPDRIATRSVRWAFGSRSLNASALTFATIAIVVPLTVFRGMVDAFELFEIAMILLVMIGSLLAPFFAWNAGTLSRPRLMRWWVPRWPGWKTVLATSVLFLTLGLLNAASDTLSGGYGVVSLSAFLAGSVLSVVGWLFIAVLWLDAGSFAHARRDIRNALRWTVFRQLLWQSILGWFAFVCVLAPVASIAIMTIYIIPQYDAWANAHGQSISDSLQIVANTGRLSSTYWYGPIGAMTFYPLLILGRLLRMNGIGGLLDCR